MIFVFLPLEEVIEDVEIEARIATAPYVNEISACSNEFEVIIPSGEIFKLIKFEEV